MTLKQLYVDYDLINDSTRIVVRDSELRFHTEGHWFSDNVLNYGNREIRSFTWQDDNTVFVEV